MTDETNGRYDNMIAVNRARGLKAKTAIYNAMIALGYGEGAKVLRKDVMALSGINSVSASKYMRMVREGWKPEE